ncbi:hypothetical protein B0A50_08381 [Salinomyces thailandicus]|uniref:Uncharacterized protein n=1 Tax=Salinomyces thailandicus TaxID=706561 RepID=A0A4U0TLW5_9PEZI|nr:hypothetical protein B0A50_08381 [Salinomyces thailandica]
MPRKHPEKPPSPRMTPQRSDAKCRVVVCGLGLFEDFARNPNEKRGKREDKRKKKKRKEKLAFLWLQRAKNSSALGQLDDPV